MRSSAAGTGVRSEVAFWLERRGIEPRDEAVSRIFGAAGEPYEQYAVRLGTAFQLTNILRDVGTDWDLGRLYLPLEDLRRFRYSETELGQRVENRNFQDLMAFETDRARGCFRDAAAILRQNKLRKFLPSEMMRRFYEALLTRLERERVPSLRKKVSLSPVRKLILISASLLKS